MLVAVICDQHFGVRGDNPNFLDKQQQFYEQVFFPTLAEHNIKTVIDLGDTFDRRKYVNFLTMQRAEQMYFDVLQQRDITLHSVVGNHNAYYKNTNHVNSIDLLLKKYPNVFTIEDTTKTLTLGSTSVTLVPWITSSNEQTIFDQIKQTTSPILMGHFEIQGFEMIRGRVCDHGLERTLFSTFDSVYSGHFHHPSEYGNIKYLGAPYEMNWSDFDGKRGFHIFDTETREMTHVPNPFVMFHKFTYDDTDQQLTAEDVQKLDVSLYAGSYIKIVVEEKTNPFVFDLLVDKFQSEGARDVKVIEADLVYNDTDDPSEILNQAEDTVTIMNNYIDRLDLGKKTSKLKDVMIGLYNESNSL